MRSNRRVKNTDLKKFKWLCFDLHCYGCYSLVKVCTVSYWKVFLILTYTGSSTLKILNLATWEWQPIKYTTFYKNNVNDVNLSFEVPTSNLGSSLSRVEFACSLHACLLKPCRISFKVSLKSLCEWFVYLLSAMWLDGWPVQCNTKVHSLLG